MLWLPVFSVRLPYPISANRYFRDRVVPARGERAAIVQRYVTKEAREFQEEIRWLLRKVGVRQPLVGRVRLDVQLYPACPQDWRKRMRADPLWWGDTVQRIDVDNANKVLIDALKGVAIVDDKQVWKLTGEIMEPQEGVAAATVLRICRAVKDNPQQEIPQRPQVEFP